MIPRNKQGRMILFVFLLVTPVPALADNCSGLFDCFGNMRAAAAAAMGLALFGALVSMGLDFIPFVGTIKGGIEAITGRDLITGQELSAWERALGVLPFAAGIAGVVSATRALDKASDLWRALDKTGDALRAGDKAADAGKGIDKTSDAWRGLSKTADNVADAGAGIRKEKIPNTKCTTHGEPVDVATGRMFTESVDFELPGPVPVRWGRIWYSDSVYNGPLGHGWHHRYDMALQEDEKLNNITLRNEDGRDIYFQKPEADQKIFHRRERLELSRKNDSYLLWNIENRLHYHFKIIPGSNEWKLIRIENTNHHAITLDYNKDGRLNRIIDSAGREIKILHNQDGRIASVHLPDPQKANQTFAAVTYLFDKTNSDLVRVTDAMDENNIYEYSNHLLVKRILRNGIAFYFRYDAEFTGARCIKTWGDGNFLGYDFQYAGEKTIVINSLGYGTDYTHSNGLVISETDSRGATKKHNYNTYNELISELNVYNHATLYEYDERGNRTSVQYPDGISITTMYRNDLPVKGSDRNGNEWQWGYDENGNLIERILPTGDAAKYEYRNGFLTSSTDLANNRTYYNYDEKYNLKDVIGPDGTISSRLYNNLGSCIKFTDAKGNERWVGYDLKSRAVQINEPDGNVRYILYDGVDNIISVKDREKETRFEYTQLNSLAAKYEGGRIVRFHYNTESHLIGVTNENGDEYKLILDGENDIIAETGFDGLTRNFTRNLAGRITKVNQPDGNNIYYEYDVMDRISQIHYADGENIVYRYSKAGQLIEAINSQVKVQFEYDVLGRKIKEQQGAYTVNSEYDILDNRVRVTSGVGADIQFRYDGMSNLTNIEAGAWQAAMQYDELRLEIKRSLPGNLIQEWKRDKEGQPLSQHIITKDPEKRTRSYQWRINDKLEQITDNRYGLSKFEYDVLGNLTGAIYDNGSKQYRVVDQVNNYYKHPEATDRQYGKAGQLLESDTFSYKYDKCGNLIEKAGKDGKTWKYQWNASGMLKEVQRPDGKIISFQYDALGRRIAKQSQQKSIRWVWDGDVPLHEFSENKLGEDNVNDLITWIFEEKAFSPAAKLSDKQSYSIINDYLGTPLEMYNEDGEKTWNNELGIYGNTRNSEGSLNDCPFRYKGQYEDEETGLYYNRFRYYDPESGIYISQDPIGLLGGNELYSYVNDPNFFVDIFGLNTGLGNIGEKYVRDLLTKSGNYSEIITIQNNSGHGVDILAKNQTTGQWEAFEVKTTQTTKSPSLSKAQAGGAHNYTTDRLTRARDGLGHYKNLPAADRVKAGQILNEIQGQGGIKTGQKYEVFADAHRQVTTVKTKVWC